MSQTGVMNTRTCDKYYNIDFVFDTNHQVNHSNIRFGIEENNTFIVIPDLLTKTECANIIANTTNYYSDLSSEYLQTDRQAERILNMNKNMAEIIYGRIKDIVEDECNQIKLKPYGFGTDGTWVPIGLNDCFRHSKYAAPSIGFNFHRDSAYIANANERSVLSLVIYCNDDYKGGSTLFVKPKSDRIIGQIVSEELSNGYDNLYEYPIQASIGDESDEYPPVSSVPNRVAHLDRVCGSAILFNHNIIHAGLPVISGTKYIIRSDVLFKNITPSNDLSWMTNEYFLQAIEYYREAKHCEMKGDVKLASQLYERGLALRQFH